MSLELLLSAAARMLAFGAAVWVLLRALRVRNPHLESLAWRSVLLVGIALPAVLVANAAPSFATSLELPLVTATTRALASAGEITAPISSSMSFVLAAIYLAVASWFTARLATGLLALRGIRRAARPMAAADDVRISERIRSPATFGTTILLPAGADAWDAAKFEPVIAHERAHVRARDCYWSWLAQLHAAIFWFNPFAWWLQRRLELLAENTSDDAVVAERHDPRAYAALLLDFARNPNSRRAAMSVAESNVPERIDRLLADTPPARALPRAARWAVFALVAPLAILVAATTHAAPPSGPAAQGAARDGSVEGLGIVQPANPDDYYPGVAVAANVEGQVVLVADLDAMGQLVDVRVVSVEPADPSYGFADAALEVARHTGYVSRQNLPGSLKFMVKFKLAD
jgi:beta-lactamase regulating signal transducer with metallopeptidase domain